MKITRYLSYRLLFLSVIMLTSCTKDFEDINSDPNRIEEVSPATLLNPIIYGLASHNMGRADAITFNLMQVSVPFPSVSGGLHRYDVSMGIGNSSWNSYYRWLKNIQEMRIASEKANDANYEAIALTLNAWVYANLTDLFGPVPMTEAVMAEEGVLYPDFESQETIYRKILADLERANTLYDLENTSPYMEDLLFQNDMSRWQKFTNSLYLRLLLRLSNRPEMNALEQLSQMLQNPEVFPVFESTEESAILQVTGVEPNVSPWGRPQDFRLSTKIASFFIDHLNTWEDPRRPVIATQATETDSNQATIDIGYKGIPSAFPGSDTFTYDASTFNIEQVTNPMQIFLLTYAEVEFIKAEVAQRSHLDDAEEHYNNGVIAAMEQLGITEIPESYFENPETAYNSSLEQIMLQKYYALYFTDYQQWFEYRRTGLPELPKTEAMFNDGIVPSRLFYPTDLAIENPEGYSKGVDMLGGSDDINTKVWWDQ